MSVRLIHQCECEICQTECSSTPEQEQEQKRHHKINLLLSRLDEQQRRWFVAFEAQALGEQGVRLMAQISGLDEKTIRRGRAELDQDLENRPTTQIRLSGGGRHSAEKKR
jgi:hypothetical protein